MLLIGLISCLIFWVALVEPETAMTKKLRAVWEAFTENVRKVRGGRRAMITELP